MRARAILKCKPALRNLYTAQPRETRVALGAWIVRYTLTGDEPTADALPPEVWEAARGMIRPARREGGTR